MANLTPKTMATINRVIEKHYGRMVGYIYNQYYASGNYYLESAGWEACDLLNEAVINFLNCATEEKLADVDHIEKYVVQSILKTNVRHIVINLVRNEKYAQSKQQLVKDQLYNEDIFTAADRIEFDQCVAKLDDNERTLIRNPDSTIQDVTTAMHIKTERFYSLRKRVKRKLNRLGYEG